MNSLAGSNSGSRFLRETLQTQKRAALRSMRVYGGAQGIWVDKATTGTLSPDGQGITVSILHTGRHYPDDLSDDGLIYHYPTTGHYQPIDLQ
jgi:putative restriction endonuclease